MSRVRRGDLIMVAGVRIPVRAVKAPGVGGALHVPRYIVRLDIDAGNKGGPLHGGSYVMAEISCLMKKPTKRQLTRLAPPTLANRFLTGWYVATGRLSLFKTRLVRLSDAIGMAAVAVIPSLLAVAAFTVGFLLGEVDGRRAAIGFLTFTGFIALAIATSYGSLRYHMGGAGSETD